MSSVLEQELRLSNEEADFAFFEDATLISELELQFEALDKKIIDKEDDEAFEAIVQSLEEVKRSGELARLQKTARLVGGAAVCTHNHTQQTSNRGEQSHFINDNEDDEDEQKKLKKQNVQRKKHLKKTRRVWSWSKLQLVEVPRVAIF